MLGPGFPGRTNVILLLPERHSAPPPSEESEGSIGVKFSTKLNVENVENFWAAFVNIFSPGEILARVLHRDPGSRSD